MRKLLISISALAILAGLAGCGPKLTDSEKNAPPPAGPHGQKLTPPDALHNPQAGNKK